MLLKDTEKKEGVKFRAGNQMSELWGSVSGK